MLASACNLAVRSPHCTPADLGGEPPEVQPGARGTQAQGLEGDMGCRMGQGAQAGGEQAIWRNWRRVLPTRISDSTFKSRFKSKNKSSLRQLDGLDS